MIMLTSEGDHIVNTKADLGLTYMILLYSTAVQPAGQVYISLKGIK